MGPNQDIVNKKLSVPTLKFPSSNSNAAKTKIFDTLDETRL